MDCVSPGPSDELLLKTGEEWRRYANLLMDTISRLGAENRRLVEANRVLAESRDAAAAANTRKSAFLASMSHELRTPMNGIIGFTDLVLETELTKDQREELGAVKHSAESLLILLNDLLDLSKIEAGGLDIEQTPFPLRAVLRDALKALELRAAAKSLRLVCQVEDNLPDVLIGDPLRLRQVLINLAGNAVKFTTTGEVAVRVEARHCDGKKVLARVSVADTGIGVPQEKQDAIFEAYRQADSATAREYGGTGLGLSISSKLVGLMGGKLGLVSEPGKGSTFSFTIPLGIGECAALTCSQATECPVHIQTIARRRILLAEDHPVSQRLAVKLLEKQGHEVSVAANGAEALELFARRDFDLVLMDVEMPEMDGLAATRAIREQEQAGSRHVPIVAMTAHALKGDSERFLAAGMDGYISKPIRAQDLAAVIESTLASAKHATHAGGPRKPVERLPQRTLRGC